MTRNAIRQPCVAATAPPIPDAEHLPEQAAGHEGGGKRRAQPLGKTLTTTAMPTLP